MKTLILIMNIGVDSMMVIYHDVGGAHSTVVAAHIHVSDLPMDSVPTKEEILNLKTFDKIEQKDQGHLIHIGKDEFGLDVYTISRQFSPNLVINALQDMYRIYNGDLKGLYIFGTMPSVNGWMKLGGFTSRRWGWVKFGRPIVAYGTLKAYPDIVQIVKYAKGKIASDLNRS